MVQHSALRRVNFVQVASEKTCGSPIFQSLRDFLALIGFSHGFSGSTGFASQTFSPALFGIGG